MIGYKFLFAAREEEGELVRCLKHCRLPFTDWVCNCQWLANSSQRLNKKVGKWCLCTCIMVQCRIKYNGTSEIRIPQDLAKVSLFQRSP